jgi:hypothetical protein
MALSMYQASVPVFDRHLGAMMNILAKGETFAEARKIDPAVLIQSRLAPDMFALGRQVQIAADAAKGCIPRLAGAEVPSWEDNETTFEQLKERCARTRDFIGGFTAEQVDGSEGREVVLTMRTGSMTFTGQDYLLNFALPNFFFHMSMTYAILRHNGADVGKRDFLAG